ncbi:MAG TPA: hypothetical protein O0Y05_04160 [Methanocorpusculum sp.]|nr:hypothetical protein [Methanocorpusculum sp.]
MEADENRFLLGHEIGHQICEHKPYHVFGVVVHACYEYGSRRDEMDYIGADQASAMVQNIGLYGRQNTES